MIVELSKDTIQLTLEAYTAHHDTLSFPPPHLAPDKIQEKLKTAGPDDDLGKMLREATEQLKAPAIIFQINGKPFATPGIFGGLHYRTDCLNNDDPEASGRISGVANARWGPASSGRVPIEGEIVRGGTEAFNVDALSFTLASFLASQRNNQEGAEVTSIPSFWIGNAAVRDERHPTGVSFYLAHLKGDVIALVTGLDGFAEVKNEIIGAVWEIDIAKVIHSATLGVDDDTHFRSRFLDAAAQMWAKGIDILKSPTSPEDIPSIPKNITSGDGTVTTKLGHGDGFENGKLRLHWSEVDQLGWKPGDALWIEINGKKVPAVMNGAIADGHSDTLVVTRGSTWHGTPPKDPFVDFFWNKRRALELFRNPEVNPMVNGLPVSGDTVTVSRRTEDVVIPSEA